METYTCKQLIEICKRHGIKNYSNKKKALIIDLIIKSNISTVFTNTRSHDAKIKHRTEVQSHGFIWESEILSKRFGIMPGEISYSNAMDIPEEHNLISSVNISIKTTCNPKMICMADAMSLYKHTASNASFNLLVIIYAQIDLGKKIAEIVEINLQDSHDLLFGKLGIDELAGLDTLIKKVPQKRSPTTEEHEEIYNMRDKLQKKCYLQLNVKCNSQQSRLQCSFNKFQEFIAMNPERIIYHSRNNIYHDISLTEILGIPPRKFKK
jgi:hypothetical protein